VKSKVVKYTQDMSIPKDPTDWVGRLVHADYLDEQGLHTQAARQRWHAGFIKYLQEHPEKIDGLGGINSILNDNGETTLPKWAIRLAAVTHAHDTNKGRHLTPEHVGLLHKAERIGLGLEPLQPVKQEVLDRLPHNRSTGSARDAIRALYHPVIFGRDKDSVIDPFMEHDWIRPGYILTGGSKRFSLLNKLKSYSDQNPPPPEEVEPVDKYHTNLGSVLKYKGGK